MSSPHATSRARRSLISCAAAACLVWAAGGSAVLAADAVNDDGLVVTGHLEETLPSQLSHYGARVDVVTPTQLDHGGFVDVSQALEMSVPGLYLAPRNGPFSYIDASLQGSRAGQILYLIDGVRISNRLYDTTAPLDTVPAHMVDRIEVLDGGQGLFYGTTAVAGVVNIITRPFTDHLAGKLEAGGDTNQSWNVDGYASGSFGGHKLVAYASHDQAVGYQPFPTADFQPSATDRNRGYRLTTLGAKYAYDFSDALRFSAAFQHTQGFVDSIRPTDAAMATNDRDENLASAKIDWLASDALQVYVKGYWHDWDSHYNETDNIGGALVVVDPHEFWGFHDYGVNAMAKLTPAKGVETLVGYDLQEYGGRDDVLLIAQQNEKTQAVFGQLRLTPDLIPRVHLAAGVRYNAPSVGESATVWNASGQFDLTDELYVRGSAGTSFQLPDAEELFAIDPINNGEIGNPNLRPEHSTNFDAALGGRFPMAGSGVSWEVIGFWRTTKDLISLDGPTPDPDVFTFINLPDKVKTSGFEAVLNAQVTPSVSVNLSYTHNSAHQVGSSLQLAAIPKDIAQGGIDLHPTDSPFGASVLGNWVGSVGDDVSSGFGRIEHGHYVVFDLDGHFDFGPSRHQRLSVRVENLFDENYTTSVRRAFTDATGDAYLVHALGAPRTLHVKYSYSF